MWESSLTMTVPFLFRRSESSFLQSRIREEWIHLLLVVKRVQEDEDDAHDSDAQKDNDGENQENARASLLHNVPEDVVIPGDASALDRPHEPRLALGHYGVSNLRRHKSIFLGAHCGHGGEGDASGPLGVVVVPCDEELPLLERYVHNPEDGPVLSKGQPQGQS